ncbi:Maf family protein [Zhaonella formicivorans]|uniref:Maf family protein n=1 Tax=Zhaonella formicivorans TaxID=2528593 RepID=UPI0010E0795B|nr:Maf family protein [Zhaonella formicivorans]
MRLILASQSPRRKELLKQIGLEFEIIVSQAEEKLEGDDPVILAEKLALKKAEEVAGQIDGGLVLGADTIVVLGGTILGKPQSKKEAVQMLTLLSGQKHRVITGVALIDAATKERRLGHEITEVKFRELTEQEIRGYVETKEYLDKAGAYGIQGLGALLVERIEGCYYNVVGLPLTRLYLMLKDFGFNVF